MDDNAAQIIGALCPRYFVRHPDRLFGEMVPNRNTDVGENGESAVSRESGGWAPMLAPDNPYLLLSHAICAAAELPLRVMGRHNGPGTFPWQPESEEASAGSQCLRITPTTHYSTPRDVLTPRASLLVHELDTYLLASTPYSMSPRSTALTLSIYLARRLGPRPLRHSDGLNGRGIFGRIIVWRSRCAARGTRLP